MRGVLLLFLFLLSLFCSSCFTSNNKKSPLQLKREDGKCNGNYLRQQHNAIHPKELKTAYFAINDKGDTVQVEYKRSKDLGSALGYGFFGNGDTIPIKMYKGKKFTGTSMVLVFDDDQKNPMHGCYKNTTTYKDGLPLFTEVYYPNGQLKKKLKGINKGMMSGFTVEYDMNGRLLKLVCRQKGLYFSHWQEQEKTAFNTQGYLGYVMRLIDTTLPYHEGYKIERFTRNQRYGYDRSSETYCIENRINEIILYLNYYDSTGALDETRFRLCFYDYGGIGERSFSYPRNEYNSDTVFRLHIEYLDYGGIKTLGQYFMNKKHGIWNYYHNDGSLKDVELYESGRKHFSLHDENAFIYFHALYDKETGEVLQYKNDWVPHINRDSMFLYDFNRYLYYRHKKEKDGFLSFWSLSRYVDHHSNKLDKLLESFYRKEHYSDGRTKAIGFVTEREERAGIWIDFSHNGDTVVICDYYYGKPNGMYRKYINEVLVEKRDEIPEWRKDDPWFFLSIPYEFPKGQFFKRRNYWFRHWQEK